jgi:hypothetical protein
MIRKGRTVFVTAFSGRRQLRWKFEDKTDGIHPLVRRVSAKTAVIVFDVHGKPVTFAPTPLAAEGIPPCLQFSAAAIMLTSHRPENSLSFA